MSRLRVAIGRLVGLGLLAGGVQYLLWRTTTLQGTGVLGAAVFAAEAAGFLFVSLTIVLLWRYVPPRRPSPAIPSGTLDILIPVCGEPVEMVERTLDRALAISYPHDTLLLNDGKIAGKPGWEAIEALAERRGVRCLTRANGARGKAGNLNYGLRNTGADLVAVIDADHQAEPDLAEQLLGYFEDPRVALVTTPQQFEGHDDDVLNNSELFFYCCMQPVKDSVNSAISCGNATVYRRSALQEIGGFSEWNLVEDVHTTYLAHARGWRSVYHPRALTIGTAPQTAAELARQRMTWAADNLRILLLDCPLFKRGLTGWQRAHYLHMTAFYVVASMQVVMWVAPALYLLWGIPPLRVSSLGELLLHALPYYGAAALYLLVTSPGILSNVRGWAQKIFLSPIYALAGLRVAARSGIRPRVTEKVSPHRFDWIIVPSELAMALTLAGLAAGILDWTWVVALVTLVAAGISFVLAGVVTAVSEQARTRRHLRVALRLFAVAAAIAVLVPGIGRLHL